jgi:predicted MFS family arabinose efflux permease
LAPEARGVAVSLFNSCFFFGQAIGAALIGFAADQVGYNAVLVTTGVGLLALCWWFAWAANRP